MMNVSVPPDETKAILLPRICSNAVCIRGVEPVITIPICIPPLGPPPGGAKFSQSSVYSELAKLRLPGR